MLEVIAALLTLSLLADDGRAAKETQRRLRRALYLDTNRWTFHFVAQVDDLLYSTAAIVDRVLEKHPGLPVAPLSEHMMTPEPEALATLRRLIELGHEPDLMEAAAQQFKVLVDEAGPDEYHEGSKWDWRTDLSPQFEMWAGALIPDEVAGEFWVAGSVTVDLPTPTPRDPQGWFAQQLMRLFGEDAIFDSALDAPLGNLDGHAVIVGVDLTGRSTLVPSTTDQQRAYIEARELLDKPLDRRGWTDESKLFFLDIWTQIMELAEGRRARSGFSS
jgi:hypothetical protein